MIIDKDICYPFIFYHIRRVGELKRKYAHHKDEGGKGKAWSIIIIV
jgi:hypothetical protein